MNAPARNPNRLALFGWAAFALAALVVWPALCHRAWHNWTWPLHGLPAFFLGLVVFLIFGGLAKLGGGAWRHGRRWLVGRQALGGALATVVLVMSAVVLFYALEYWRGKRAWARVVAQVRQAGQSLEPKSFSPAPVPANQDFAQVPLFAPLWQATTLARDTEGHRLEPDLGRLGSVLRLNGVFSRYDSGLKLAQWLEGHPTDFTPWLAACQSSNSASAKLPETNRLAAAAAILKALSPFEDMIEELRTYSARPFCQLPFDYDFAYFSEFYPERVMLAFMRMVRLRASAELALGRHDAAFEDLQLGLRLAWHLRLHPTPFRQSERALAFADGLQPLWEGLAAKVWTAAQFETLQRQLADFNPLADYPAQARFLAAINASFVESILPAATPREDAMAKFAPEGQQTLRWVRRVYPAGWSLQDQAEIWSIGRQQEDILVRTPALHLAPASDISLARQMVHASSDPFFPIYLVPKVNMMYGELQTYLPFAQAMANLAVLACALERHRLAHGDYPEALATLAPAFVSQVPSDPMSGSTPCYRRLTPGAFVLYSVGFNHVDNHGRLSVRQPRWNGTPDPVPDLRTGDWVWTVPGGGLERTP